MTGRTQYAPTLAQIDELRTTSDRAMGRKYGTHGGVWRRIRLRHGIERHRPPTTLEGAPTPWVAKPERTGFSLPRIYVAPIPQRDTSVAGEAAAFLRRQRFPNVFNRKVLGKSGWQCGRETLSAGELVAKAERFGFVREGWMG